MVFNNLWKQFNFCYKASSWALHSCISFPIIHLLSNNLQLLYIFHNSLWLLVSWSQQTQSIHAVLTYKCLLTLMFPLLTGWGIHRKGYCKNCRGRWERLPGMLLLAFVILKEASFLVIQLIRPMILGCLFTGFPLVWNANSQWSPNLICRRKFWHQKIPEYSCWRFPVTHVHQYFLLFSCITSSYQ